MMKAYARCLQSKGASAGLVAKTTGYGTPADGDFSGDASKKFKTARVACASKEPEYYQDREKREDPSAFKNHQRAQIKCMRAHGLAIETDADGWGYTNPGRDMGSTWDKKCQLEAFGG
jgi:hypothetical protein